MEGNLLDYTQTKVALSHCDGRCVYNSQITPHKLDCPWSCDWT